MRYSFIFCIAIIALFGVQIYANDSIAKSLGYESTQYFETRFNTNTDESSYNTLSSDDEVGYKKTIGIDIFSTLTQDDLTCLRKAGNVFTIASGYIPSPPQVNKDMINNVIKAHNAGFKNVDVYMTPCANCANLTAKQQITQLWDSFSHTGSVGMIWLDTRDNNNWDNDPKKNHAFIVDFITYCAKMKANIGVLATKKDWEKIFGADYDYLQFFPLWYITLDNNPSWAEYPPDSFGGWTRPSIKRFSAQTTDCKSPPSTGLNSY